MSLKLIKPKKLVIGDTIGIIAPSAGNANIFPHRIDNATKMLKSLGYKVKLSENALEINGYVSASAQKRASDIHSMFEDDDVSAVLCTIGGNHSNSLLKLIDFDLIKNNPKIFIGYSDISVLHYAFMKKANLQTFYGPCLMTQFGEYPQILSYTLDYFNKAVGENAPIGEVKQSDRWTAEILDWTKKQDLERPRKLLETNNYEWLKKGKASGKIIGGCVPSINHLIGTDYWIDPSDMILFIDIPEGHEFGKGLPISDLDSYFTDLDNIGVFENISGLIIGRPYNYSDEENNMLKNIIVRLTSEYDYPILFNVNIGHCDPIITLPYNADVVLDSDNNSFAIN
jgi:muramoyltetrapeptide carboxypeptidase